MKFSDAIGPTYHYEEQTNRTLGDQPNLRDPLAQCPRTDLNKRFLPKPMTTTG